MPETGRSVAPAGTFSHPLSVDGDAPAVLPGHMWKGSSAPQVEVARALRVATSPELKASCAPAATRSSPVHAFSQLPLVGPLIVASGSEMHGRVAGELASGTSPSGTLGFTTGRLSDCHVGMSARAGGGGGGEGEGDGRELVLLLEDRDIEKDLPKLTLAEDPKRSIS